ncbi:MAG: hypothetical protein ABI333_08555 [bacterium]
MRRIAMFCGVIVVGAVVCSGCKKDDFSDAIIGKLRSCGLLTSGNVGLFAEEPSTSEEQCYADCYLGASCDDLAYMMCQVGTMSAATQACFAACEPPDWTCADGVETISESYVCDGYEDCSDASDEVGCSGNLFECADGTQTVPIGWRCDGEADCYDGSDEVGCSAGTTWQCDDGEVIPADNVCDFGDDCVDGSDEMQNCAEIVCPN